MLPPLHLLAPAPAQTEMPSPETLEFTSRLIERKLAEFGVQVRHRRLPGAGGDPLRNRTGGGRQGAQIVNLARDLARALALVSIRVVETVPGKSCMALELPNPRRQTVRLSEIVASKAYQDMASPLTLTLARTSAASRWWSTRQDAAPAGRGHHRFGQVGGYQRDDPVDGSSKSEPEKVRLIMVDPKMLELDLRGYSPSAGAGGHRHAAGGQCAQLVRRRDGKALQADECHGRA